MDAGQSETGKGPFCARADCSASIKARIAANRACLRLPVLSGVFGIYFIVLRDNGGEAAACFPGFVCEEAMPNEPGAVVGMPCPNAGKNVAAGVYSFFLLYHARRQTAPRPPI